MSLVVTNADRIVYPETGHTKGDVVEHYRRFAERILPHTRDRPLTLRRYPKGVAEQGFFQKNVPPHYPASMRRIEVPRRDGVTVHPCASEREHLPYLANQGVIELHVPASTAASLYYPDRFVIDLDPPQGALDLVRKAAHAVRDELQRFGLPTIPVATGSKGYHLVAAIEPRLGADAIALAAQQVGQLLAQRHPNDLTTTFRVASRGERVFVDWLRNVLPATVIAPFSLRARARPTVAVPIGWDELDAVPPDGFDIETSRARLDRMDPLASLAQSPVDPTPFARAVGDAFKESGLELEGFDRFRS
ncbi:MAG: ATP-dependent DNA ligase [Polyangiaceae bacterium]|nr:ATP-dependent DNA ligase [Polyangiaceae bacterium]